VKAAVITITFLRVSFLGLLSDAYADPKYPMVLATPMKITVLYDPSLDIEEI